MYALAVAQAGLAVWVIVAAVRTGDATVVAGGVALGIGAFLLPALIALRIVTRARIEMKPTELIVTTVFGQHRIEWPEVLGATAGYYGITIKLHDGRTMLSGAVQRCNLAEWLDLITRADVLADAINRRASHERREGQ